jgi:DNA-binding response OmpR family regulator
MVVEDDPVIALLLGEVLAASGHKVCAIVHDETTAVATAGTCLPDLLIVDVQLGAGCGVAAVTAITRTQAVPHLFVTGNPAAVLARRPGAVVVQKPFFGVDLCLAIDRALAVP